jgi:hypothetical protein
MPQPARRPRRAARFAQVAAGLLLCGACNYGEIVVVQPAAKAHGPLTISVLPDPEDSAPARELGFSAGIPDAEVTVSAADADTAAGPPIAVVQTDDAGTATLPDVTDGNYLVEVRRLLTAAESARLAPSEDVVGFMAKTVVPRGSVTVPTPASRRHSVVISEWSFEETFIPMVGWYEFGGYLELANNADTTVYLDGLVIGEGFFGTSYEFHAGICANYEPQTNDQDGVWSRYFDSLPGSGHDYPLAPGATAVIATDAIDHSPIVAGGLDLSHADFEFVGTADVDNPAVPNTISIGLADYWFGHGLYLNAISGEVVFVALPVDVPSLPQTPNHYVARIPRARILDVMAMYSNYVTGYPDCPHLVHRNFDRRPSHLLVDEPYNQSPGLHSVQRKVAHTRADGRKILQHTRTTSADFFWGLRTPWLLP